MIASSNDDDDDDDDSLSLGAARLSPCRTPSEKGRVSNHHNIYSDEHITRATIVDLALARSSADCVPTANLSRPRDIEDQFELH